MGIRTVVACLHLGCALPAMAGDNKLLDAAFSFQVCVRKVTEAELPSLAATKNPDWSSSEADVWSKVIDQCRKYFGDEQKGLILLHYDGDTGKALGFYEGVVASARSYVVSRSLDVLKDSK